MLQYLNQLESYGVGYKSVTEQYLDSTGMFKEAIVSILTTLAKQERVRPSKRTQAGMDRRVAQGVKMGPPTKSQQQVEQVRQLKQEGKSNYAIAKALGMSATTVAKYV